MLERFDRFARSVAEDTPPDRERYLDFLRVAAILVVVLGHWLARVVIEPDGELVAAHALETIPGSRWISWLAQVMPLFFIVGGLLNLQSWCRARERGTSGVAWVRNRARRLLRPLVPLLLVWVAVSAALRPTGREDALLFDIETAIVPVWFLGAYLVVTAFTPVLADRRPVPVLLGCLAGTVVVDWLRFGPVGELGWVPVVEGVPVFAGANSLFVWVAVHQLGCWWRDGRVLHGRRAQLVL